MTRLAATPVCGGSRSTGPRRRPTLLVAEWSAYLAAMRANLPGVLDDVDTEFLHDFRVAVRRTRSTLKLGRPALPEDVTDQWEPALKWLGGLTTPVRDLDVYELGLPVMASWLVAADPADLQPFAVQLRRHRSAARRILVRGLRSARFRSTAVRLGGRVGRPFRLPAWAGDPAHRW